MTSNCFVAVNEFECISTGTRNLDSALYELQLLHELHQGAYEELIDIQIQPEHCLICFICHNIWLRTFWIPALSHVWGHHRSLKRCCTLYLGVRSFWTSSPPFSAWFPEHCEKKLLVKLPQYKTLTFCRRCSGPSHCLWNFSVTPG